MLQLLSNYIRLNTFSDNKYNPESMVDYFGTELIDMIKYIYSDRRLNYDRLYQQEQLNNIYKVKQDKKENTEQYVINYAKKNFKCSSTLLSLVFKEKYIDNYGTIIRYSNYLSDQFQIRNKLRAINISTEQFKNISEWNLIVDSVRNYYYGSIYDLLFDPIWSLVSYFSEEYFIKEQDLNKVFEFKYDSIYNLTKLTKVFDIVMMDILRCLYQYSNSSTLRPKFEKILRTYLNNEEEVSKWMFIIYDIFLNGRFNGVIKNTDKELSILDTYIKMYRPTGIRFLYEIGGI